MVLNVMCYFFETRCILPAEMIRFVLSAIIRDGRHHRGQLTPHPLVVFCLRTGRMGLTS